MTSPASLRFRFHPLRRFVLALALGLLSACGGGGGDAPPSTNVLSGTVTPVPGMLADSDVNDPRAPYVSNDFAFSAQLISNPASISGFASAQGSGRAGSRFALIGDDFDTYRTNLAAGQVITLTVSQWNSAAPLANDLDLFLYDSSQNLVVSSEGTGQFEVLTVPAAGNYFIVVGAVTGASTYEISVGSAVLSASVAQDRLSRFDSFVDDEVVITLKPGSKGSRLAASMSALAVQDSRVGDDDTAPLLVRLPTVTALSQGNTTPPLDRWSGRPLSPDMAARAETIKTVKAYRSAPEVRSASPNYLLQTRFVPNDPSYRFQWHYPMIQLPAAWDITQGARAVNPVIVAVVDTGVKLLHPDLVNQLVPGYDFISSSVRAVDGDGIDANPDDPGDQSRTQSSSWHGTHIAGIVAAQTNNAIWGAGVAPQAKIMPLRAVGKGGGTVFDTLQCIRFAARLSNTSGTLPAQKADIINLSLGGSGFDQATQDSIALARAAGVIVVASAGNDNAGTPVYPAAYDGVISVGAVGFDRLKASYSNFGPTLDVAGPGGDRTDLNLDGLPDGVGSTFIAEANGALQFSFASLIGTSIAAPHVAGVLALMRAIAPAMSPAQVDTLLASGALTDELGAAGRDDIYGHGLINAFKAVNAALQFVSSPSTTPALLFNVNRLDFGYQGTQQTLRLENGGGGTLTVSALTDSVPWLTVTPSVVDGNGLGSYLISASRAGLAAGAYSTTLSVVTSAGSFSVPVSLGVTANPLPGNAGRIYVLLINASTNTASREFAANPSAGAYGFSFADVAAGAYRLIAGSDLDNDGFICGPGEACGGWPVGGTSELLNVNGSRANLDFSIGPESVFAQSINAAAPASPGRGLARIEEAVTHTRP